MLDPNMLPYVRMMVAAVACIPVVYLMVVFVRLWIESRRWNTRRNRGF